eukprot:182326_1
MLPFQLLESSSLPSRNGKTSRDRRQMDHGPFVELADEKYKPKAKSAFSKRNKPARSRRNPVKIIKLCDGLRPDLPSPSTATSDTEINGLITGERKSCTSVTMAGVDPTGDSNVELGDHSDSPQSRHVLPVVAKLVTVSSDHVPGATDMESSKISINNGMALLKAIQPLAGVSGQSSSVKMELDEGDSLYGEEPGSPRLVALPGAASISLPKLLISDPIIVSWTFCNGAYIGSFVHSEMCGAKPRVDWRACALDIFLPRTDPRLQWMKIPYENLKSLNINLLGSLSNIEIRTVGPLAETWTALSYDPKSTDEERSRILLKFENCGAFTEVLEILEDIAALSSLITITGDVRPQKRRRVSNSESKDVVKVVKKYEVDLKDIGSKILMPDLDTPQTPGGHVNSQPDFSDIAKRQMHLVETVKKELKLANDLASQYHLQVDELTEERDELAKSLKKSKTKTENAQRHCTKFKKELANLSTSLKNMKTKRDEYRDEVLDSRESIKNLSAEATTLKSKVEELEAANKKLNAEAKLAQEKITNHAQQNVARAREMSKVKCEKVDLSKRVRIWEAKNAKIASIAQNRHEKIQKLNKSCDEQKAYIITVEGSIVNKDIELKKTQDKLQEQTTQIESLTSDLRGKTLVCQSNTTQMLNLKADNDNLQKVSKEKETELSNSSKELLILKNINSDLNKKLQSLKTEHEAQIVEMGTELTECDRVRKTTHDNLERKRTDVKIMFESKMKLQKKYDDVVVKYNKANEELREFTISETHLRAEVKEQNARIEELTDTVNLLKQEKSKVEADCKESERIREDCTKLKLEFQTVNDQLIREKLACQSRINSLEAEVEKLRAPKSQNKTSSAKPPDKRKPRAKRIVRKPTQMNSTVQGLVSPASSHHSSESVPYIATPPYEPNSTSPIQRGATSNAFQAARTYQPPASDARLTPQFTACVEVPQPREQSTMEANKDYQVERLVGCKTDNGQVKYLVRWLGFAASEDSWEPIQNLNGCEELINEFHYHNKNV